MTLLIAVWLGYIRNPDQTILKHVDPVANKMSDRIRNTISLTFISFRISVARPIPPPRRGTSPSSPPSPGLAAASSAGCSESDGFGAPMIFWPSAPAADAVGGTSGRKLRRRLTSEAVSKPKKNDAVWRRSIRFKKNWSISCVEIVVKILIKIINKKNVILILESWRLILEFYSTET